MTKPDACFARNGVVHVIDGIIKSTNQSITEIINSNSELSTFSRLVEKAKLSRILKRRLFTVFAPTNNAIDNAVQECLCWPENKRSLVKFVLFHILKGAEYNSTLTLRSTLYPLSCYWSFKCGISVSVEEGQVSLGDTDIIATDIAASNGVIHAISEPLNNPRLDLNTLCPPPTTPPPDGSGEIPVTTSESPATTTAETSDPASTPA